LKEFILDENSVRVLFTFMERLCGAGWYSTDGRLFLQVWGQSERNRSAQEAEELAPWHQH
jgi:hypothetical protein